MAVLETSIENAYWSNAKRKLICTVEEEIYEIPITELTCNPKGVDNYFGVIRRIFKTGKVRFDIKDGEVPSIRRYEIETIKNLSENMIVNARVVRVINSGAFCVLDNGIEGFIPIVEISRGYINLNSLCDFIKKDEVFPVKILEIEQGDWPRVTLSRKQGAPDYSDKYDIGNIVTVRIISKINDQGLLCELDPKNIGFIDGDTKLTGEISAGVIKTRSKNGVWRLDAI